jgi:hypothetical protein
MTMTAMSSSLHCASRTPTPRRGSRRREAAPDVHPRQEKIPSQGCLQILHDVYTAQATAVRGCRRDERRSKCSHTTPGRSPGHQPHAYASVTRRCLCPTDGGRDHRWQPDRRRVHGAPLGPAANVSLYTVGPRSPVITVNPHQRHAGRSGSDGTSGVAPDSRMGTVHSFTEPRVVYRTVEELAIYR